MQFAKWPTPAVALSKVTAIFSSFFPFKAIFGVRHLSAPHVPKHNQLSYFIRSTFNINWHVISLLCKNYYVWFFLLNFSLNGNFFWIYNKGVNLKPLLSIRCLNMDILAYWPFLSRVKQTVFGLQDSDAVSKPPGTSLGSSTVKVFVGF